MVVVVVAAKKEEFGKWHSSRKNPGELLQYSTNIFPPVKLLGVHQSRHLPREIFSQTQ